MVQVEKEQIIEIKSQLYTKGNKEVFLEKAIRNYRDPEKEKYRKDIPVLVHGKKIIVEQVPGIEVEEERRENLLLLVAIEKVLSEMDDVPSRVQFDELLF